MNNIQYASFVGDFLNRLTKLEGTPVKDMPEDILEQARKILEDPSFFNKLVSTVDESLNEVYEELREIEQNSKTATSFSIQEVEERRQSAKVHAEKQQTQSDHKKPNILEKMFHEATQSQSAVQPQQATPKRIQI